MEVLKKKMRQSKEDLERVRDENEELSHKLQVEVQRRETVSSVDTHVCIQLAEHCSQENHVS